MFVPSSLFVCLCSHFLRFDILMHMPKHTHALVRSITWHYSLSETCSLFFMLREHTAHVCPPIEHSRIIIIMFLYRITRMPLFLFAHSFALHSMYTSQYSSINKLMWKYFFRVFFFVIHRTWESLDKHSVNLPNTTHSYKKNNCSECCCCCCYFFFGSNRFSGII